MFEKFQQLLQTYKDNPCKCKNCGVPLPISHSADHLCDKCFDEIILLETADWLSNVREALYGDQDQKDNK